MSAEQDDPDTALTAWYEAQAADHHRDWLDSLRRERLHRCDADMPPCPACQEREDEENAREFGE